jgi:hypothetical protein
MTDREHALSKSRPRNHRKEVLVIQLREDVVSAAERLIDSHGLRGFDAVHLCPLTWLDDPRVSFACRR